METIESGDPRLPERFWDKVYPCPITGCWIWAGASRKPGAHGSFHYEGQTRPVSYILAKLKGLEWDPKQFGPVLVCGNNWCSHPEHVSLRDLWLCHNGHRKTKRGRGTTCPECRRNWDKTKRKSKHEENKSAPANQLRQLRQLRTQYFVRGHLRV